MIDHEASRNAPNFTVMQSAVGMTWADIERERISRGLEASQTLADASWGRAVGYAARVAVGTRPNVLAWIAYCVGTHGTVARPKRPARRHELKLAELGIVDPLGFEYAETARAPVKRKFKGAARGAQFDRLEMMAVKLSPWVG